MSLIDDRGVKVACPISNRDQEYWYECHSKCAWYIKKEDKCAVVKIANLATDFLDTPIKNGVL